MKDVSFHEIKFYLHAKDRFSCVRAFCRASHVRASMHRITSLELLSTLMLCLVQLSNCKAQMLKRFFLSERKLLNAILRVKLKYMKDVSFSWMNVICNAEAMQGQMLKRFFLSERKLLNAFKSKAQVHENFFFLMKWNVMQCRRQISMY